MYFNLKVVKTPHVRSSFACLNL